MPDVRIAWITADGEEREECWPSIERFRAWALGEGMRCTWRAYRDDGDGEWELADQGRI